MQKHGQQCFPLFCFYCVCLQRGRLVGPACLSNLPGNMWFQPDMKGILSATNSCLQYLELEIEEMCRGHITIGEEVVQNCACY